MIGVDSGWGVDSEWGVDDVEDMSRDWRGPADALDID